jgi:hypothetical protein
VRTDSKRQLATESRLRGLAASNKLRMSSFGTDDFWEDLLGIAKVLIRIKDGDRNEAKRLIFEGIDIMTRLEHRGALDTDAQETVNKLNELAAALSSSSSKR